MRYEQLRAEYDAAFDRLRTEVSRLRSIAQQVSPNRTADQSVREHVDQALAAYRERRDQLADFLTSHRTAGIDPAGPGHRRKVEALAYRLWEQAGHPTGNPDEHWYRAERFLAGKQ